MVVALLHRESPGDAPSGSPPARLRTLPIDVTYRYLPHPTSASSEKSGAVISFDVQYFVPGHEIELCGHGTVAATKVILDSAENSPGFGHGNSFLMFSSPKSSVFVGGGRIGRSHRYPHDPAAFRPAVKNHPPTTPRLFAYKKTMAEAMTRPTRSNRSDPSK